MKKYLQIWQYNLRHKWYVMLACWERGLYLQGLLHDWAQLGKAVVQQSPRSVKV